MTDAELDKLDRQILMALQGDLDDSPEPYARIAEALDIPEGEVIRRVKKMKSEGIIRRIGAMIRHIEAGISFNGMVVWRVPPERLDEVGNRLAEFPEVTHCYERIPFGDKGGSLFTMVHAPSREGCMEIVRRLSEAVEVEDYEILFSKRELKKVSMTYFDEEAADEE
ncbi:MAG: AsnC family transcriptional regulator [Desulfomonile sp.]|nr:AsnC family transcriptional regulator [Desulfomonile sp.]